MPPHLLPDIRLKVFLLRDVDTNTTILQLCRWDLVTRDWHGSDDDVGELQTLLEGKGAMGGDVVRVVSGRRAVGRTFGEFDNC
jgi:hypothetical protein